jgi:hypothetical protein
MGLALLGRELRRFCRGDCGAAMFRGGRRRVGNRRVSWLSAFVVLLQALTPFYHAGGEAFLGRALEPASRTLCSFQASVREVAPVAEAAPPDDDGQAPGSAAPPCPICQQLKELADGFVLSSEIARPCVGANDGVDARRRSSLTLLRPRAAAGVRSRALPSLT